MLYHLKYPVGMTMGRIHYDDIHTGIDKMLRPLPLLIPNSYRRPDPEPSHLILAGTGILDPLLDILYGNKPFEIEVLIHDREFLYPVPLEDLLGIFEGRAHRGRNQLLCHHV